MVDPISARFHELTGDRYGEIELGPALETSGIQAAGDTREVELLSVGTKEQLSTIFRLSLAEQIGSAVLLDDQLTQTDPHRMVWFRNKLREIAERIQIVVLTCRPDDYLESEEHPSVDETTHDHEGTRAISLKELIERSTL